MRDVMSYTLILTGIASVTTCPQGSLQVAWLYSSPPNGLIRQPLPSFTEKILFVFSKLSINTALYILVSIQTTFPVCDFVTMRDFFMTIGPSNRRMLKHINLEFKIISQFISFLY